METINFIGIIGGIIVVALMVGAGVIQSRDNFRIRRNIAETEFKMDDFRRKHNL